MKDTEAKKETSAPAVDTTGREKNRQIVMVAVILGLLIFWGVKSPDTFLRVVLVAVGFGGIVMIHEFGHFIVAKLGGIKVEAFSIGMGPILLGIRKLKKGWKIRMLPKIGEEQHVQEGDDETEYQLALLPIGGYVKMLGQSDTGSADANDDPRSYSNRPIWIRICVVSAGVVFNAVGALLIFMFLFTNGIDLKPAMVGNVTYNSPAYDAGIRPGDRIVEVNGERFIDIESVVLAPALSSSGEEISFVVSQPGGEERQINVVAEKRAGDPSGLRSLGISPAATLEIEPMMAKEPALIQEIYTLTGLYPKDEIKAINGKSVAAPWEFEKEMKKTFYPETPLTVSRVWQQQEATGVMVNVGVPMRVGPVVQNFRNEYDLAHFSSLVPPLRVDEINEQSQMVQAPGRLIGWIKKVVLRRKSQPQTTEKPALQKGDILVRIADKPYPNYQQLRELVEQYKDQDLPVAVQRMNENGESEVVELTVHPKTDPATGRVLMGISPSLDMADPVVAQVLPVAGQGQPAPTIPPGARITSVDGKPVSSFYEIARIMQENRGNKISIDYEYEGQSGGTAVFVSDYEPVHAEASVAVPLPMSELTETFRADNPIEAASMGMKKVWQFVSRSYVTLGRLFQGSVPVSALSGPVGIISMTYKVAGTTMDHYLYFLGLISSCLAVMNLLPLPVLDGGHIVLLIIEKITGKPVHEKILTPIMYIGLALLLGVIIWISYNDMVRLLFGS